MKTLRSILLACLMLVPLARPAWAAPEPASTLAPARDERWFVMLMQGKKAGHAVNTQVTDQGRITTSTSMTLEIKRQNLKMSVSIVSEAVELADGTPVSLKSEQRLGAMPMTTTYTWKGPQVEVKIGEGRPELRPAPPGDWMMPARMERYVRERLAAGDTTITVKMIEPSMGLEPITMTRTLVAREPVEVLGRTVPGIRWKVTVDRPQNLTMEEFTDEQGESAKSVISMGFISIEQVLADKDLALREGEAPELLMSTLVKVDRPINNARTLTTATYRVSTTSGDLPDLPTTAGQVFEREAPGKALLRVGAPRAEARDRVEADRAALLGTSSMIDPADPALDDLLAKAQLTASMSTLDKARRLRDVVHAHIQQKDLSVGFATSREVARTRTGDCTEHGVLLAALCRKAGIPARVASGLIFMPEIEGEKNVFGYHLWTQVLAPAPGAQGEAFYDVDAVLPAGFPLSDATHIALVVSDLRDDQMQNFMVTSAPLIGRMKIEVIEASK